jgi:hypothetical protein
MTNHLLAPAPREGAVVLCDHGPRALTPSTTDGVDGARTGRFVNWHRHPRAMD